MKRYFYVWFLAVCLILPTAAWADVTYIGFSYSGAGVTASGNMSVTSQGGDEYLITGITGTRNLDPITALDPSPLADGTVLDNLIFFTLPTPTSATFTPIGVAGCNTSAADCTSGFAFTAGGNEFQAYTWTGGVYPGTSGPNYPAGQYEFTEGTWPVPFTNTELVAFTITSVD